MEYSVQELAKLSGVTPRTLRWYDRIGLLKPARTAESGYRYYGPQEVDRLQEILFCRELGMELKEIGEYLDRPDYDRTEALQKHLAALQQKKARLEAVIRCVEETIEAKEQGKIMKDKQKFEAFKRQLVDENEKKYGKEARQKYGDRAVDAANAVVMGRTPEEQAEWTALDAEILRRLEEAVKNGASPAEEAGRAVAELHRRWLTISMGSYDPARHRGIAELYVQDERFTAYYDRTVSGCACFLRDAVRAHIG